MVGNSKDRFSGDVVQMLLCFSIKTVPAVTALKYRGGLQLGVGMSTGHVSTSCDCSEV